MKVELEKAQTMLVELGYPTAPKWPAKRVAAFLTRLPTVVDEDGVTLDSDEAVATFDATMEALEKNETVEVVGKETEAQSPEPETKPEPAPAKKKAPKKKKAAKGAEPAKATAEPETKPQESEGKGKPMAKKKAPKKKAPKKKAPAKGKAKAPVNKKTGKPLSKKKVKKGSKAPKKGSKKATKAKAPKKDPIGKDKWGFRLGSKVAAFNASITKKAKSMKQIMEETGDDQTRYNHANKLIELGHIKCTDEGYVLA